MRVGEVCISTSPQSDSDTSLPAKTNVPRDFEKGPQVTLNHTLVKNHE